MIRAACLRASFLALLAVAPVLGCGTPARAPGPPGETLILLENRVAGPCELKWANARVDDQPLGRVTLAPTGSEPAPLDRPVLTPGEHTVSIAAAVTCPAGGGSESSAVLQVTQPVYMGKAGGKITITLASKPDTDSGLEASFTVAGGQVLAPRADGGDVDCRARQPMDWAICRTETELARAIKLRDVVRASCISDRLREMKLLSGTLGSQAIAPSHDDGALADVATDATNRVLVLAGEAELCRGFDAFVEGGTHVDHEIDRKVPAFR